MRKPSEHESNIVKRAVETPHINEIRTLYQMVREKQALRQLYIIYYGTALLLCGITPFLLKPSIIAMILSVLLLVYITHYALVKRKTYTHETKMNVLKLDKKPIHAVMKEGRFCYIQYDDGRVFEQVKVPLYELDTPKEPATYTLMLGEQDIYQFVALPTKQTFF